ncbi:MAG: LysE family transporter [Nitrosopumilaceae archaeon]|nr:LysE family transporter [Nitrosopumilaceae archaeon]NIT99757.1 LysE family transporter [Nitrosopumilaceae archaeon]NIU88619.1 LysE family transporter [Nitrosopumilaceae archaeon]NIV64893.1 LysE family transporter [Nitrosopumilaceae archaeon]NIX60360.1 LysE family transporter [Nitrosopumilaceae archaeon]
MLEFFTFSLSVILISASGVMSPGPLFASNVLYGIKEGLKGGIKVSVGHAVIEFPLVVLLGVGVLSFESFPEFRTLVSILGGLALFAFAGFQIKNVLKQSKLTAAESKHGAIVSGIFLTGLNPFFLIWWFTIGFKLISDALLLWSLWGIGILFLLHIWMDFAWLGLVAFLAAKSKKILSNNSYKLITLGISGILVYFGILFTYEGFFQPQSTISMFS